MRHKSTKGIPGVYIEGSYRGHKAIPGAYTFSLKMGDQEVSTTASILPNPFYTTSPGRYQSYSALMTEMEDTYSSMHESVNKLNGLQTQLTNIVEKLPTEEKYLSLRGKGQELLKRIKTWDETMVQRKSKAYDDVENFPNGFTANYFFLINQTESDIPHVNQASLDRKKELDTQWVQLNKEVQRLLKNDIPTFNKALWDAGIGALWSK